MGEPPDPVSAPPVMKPEHRDGGFPGSGAFVARWMQEIAPYGIFTTDTELRIDSWNRWMAVHSGKSAGEVIGRRLIDLYPQLEARHQERFERALTGEISVLSAALHKHLLPFPPVSRQDEVAHMLQTARVAPLTDAQKVVGTITIIEDVTQREIQAAILHRQQELDRLLSTALGALLQSRDPAKDVAEIFPLLLPSLGLDAYFSYLLGSSRTTLHLNAAGGVSPKQRDLLAVLPVSSLDPVTGPVGESSLPVTIASHLESLRELGLRACCCFPMWIGDRVIGLVSFGSYHKETIPSSDRAVLSRVARYVGLAVDRAARERDVLAASRAKDDFLAALSHELRTPLNPVLLLASDSAANPQFPAEAREAFRVIEKNALLEARLIDDLLDLTRIAHGKTALEATVVDVHDTLRDALVTVRADATARALALAVDLQATRSKVKGDSARLQQVFWNLLKNAVKFTPAGGAISVTSRVDEITQQLVITITDTGIGLEPHEVDRIFGAFVQGDHAASGRNHQFGGLGLGLAISRKLIELHSGEIEAHSQGRDRGSTFVVRLPLILQPDELMVAAGLTGPDAAPAMAVNNNSGSKPSGGRILLVEDHEPTRAPLTRLLVRRGYDVVPVGTASAALEAAEVGTFDLVLSDIGLPDSDGYTLMKSLRDRHGIPGIALTGYGMHEDVARSNEAGFVAHLTKPISVALLDQTLAAAFSRSRTNG